MTADLTVFLLRLFDVTVMFRLFSSILVISGVGRVL